MNKARAAAAAILLGATLAAGAPAAAQTMTTAPAASAPAAGPVGLSGRSHGGGVDRSVLQDIGSADAGGRGRSRDRFDRRGGDGGHGGYGRGRRWGRHHDRDPGPAWSGGGFWPGIEGYDFNRTSRANGYFGHGSADGHGYDYDRGYPYDHYEDRSAPATYQAAPRRIRCEVRHVPDGNGRGSSPVRVCTG